MKRTFANLVQKSLVAALLVFGTLLFSASRAEAQQNLSQMGGNWVDANEAKLRLVADLETLGNDPLTQQIGSDSYIRAYYYKSVYMRIDSGEGVPEAVINGAGPAVAASSETRVAPAPGVALTPAQRESYILTLKSRLTN